MSNIINTPIRTGASPRITASVPAIIANGATESDAIIIPEGASLNAMVFPAAFTGASIGFKASNDGINFYTMYTVAGVALAVTVTLSGWVTFEPIDMASARFLKITGSAQGAARTIEIISRIFS